MVALNWKETASFLATLRARNHHAPQLLRRLHCLGSSRSFRNPQPPSNYQQRRPRVEQLADSNQQAVTELAEAQGKATAGHGANAKQLFQVAINSLDIFESVDPPSIDEEVSDLFEQEVHAAEHNHAAAAYSKANFEVLRIHADGKARNLYAKRRDLMRVHRLQPRDLRRLDTAADPTKASPSVTIKENVLLLNLGGCRAIVTADKALLLEPNSEVSRRFLDLVLPRLEATAGARAAKQQADPGSREYMRALLDGRSSEQRQRAPPFELEVLEAAMIMATGRLDAEVLAVTRRVSQLLTKLPREITPVNLEELRRIKSTLVELEDRAEAVVNMLEELLDDEDELRELNLSSRPRREMRREQRERARLERELERAREMKEEFEERMHADEEESKAGSSSSGDGADGADSSTAAPAAGAGLAKAVPPGGNGSAAAAPLPLAALAAPAPFPSAVPAVNAAAAAAAAAQAAARTGNGKASSSGGRSGQRQAGKPSSRSERATRLAELRAKFGDRADRERGDRDRDRERDREREAWEPLSRRRQDEAFEEDGDGPAWRGMADVEDNYADIQDEIEEYQEQQEEEEELEEIEDLLEYYLQRVVATQSEAARLLEGARDLEESIGVSLSARRYEVNRLELTLSIGSFAASVGAMIAGIFGMNMKSTLEMSVLGFWGVGLAIVVGCSLIYLAVMKYTRRRRIL